MSNPDPLELEIHLRLSLSPDRASGSLVLEPGYDPEWLTHQRLTAFLNTKVVSRESIDSDAIDELIRLGLASPEGSHTVKVCAGLEPVPGVDGHFQFVGSVQSRVEQVKHREALLKHRLNPQTQGTDTGSKSNGKDPSAAPLDEHVDFYSQSAFVIVHEGDTLGRLIPPTTGTDGLDVFTEPIEVKPGRAAEFDFDKSVRVDEDGTVTAIESGRLIAAFDRLRIETTLEIESSVSFITGNIDFPGDVNIAMGVKDRFVVRSTGNIAIRELVQACTIDCDGELHLVAGIAGRDTATIRIGGDLSGRYIEACTGTVSGTADISGEITNCTIRFEGDLISTSCSVRGGELTTAGRVDIATLGSENGTPTFLHAGSLTGLDKLLETALEIGPSLANAVDRIHTRIDSAQGFEDQDEHVNSTLQTLEAQRSASTANLSRLADAADRILELAEQRTEVHLMIRKAIHSGTVITFKGWRAEFEQRVSGPILITVDHSGQPVATGPGETTPGPLARFARVIEDPTTLRIELARARVEEMRRPNTPPQQASASGTTPPETPQAEAA